MGKSKTPTFILELALETSPHDEAELNVRFEVARQLYNACLDEAKKRLELLRQSKAFQKARKMPKTVNGKRNKSRTEAFKMLNAKFDFSEYDIHIYATTIRNSWIGNHLDSATAQKMLAALLASLGGLHETVNHKSLIEFSTKTTKLSQYCHKCGKYTKKPLSQRVHTCCNLNIQRDIYSAFLAGSIVENSDEPTKKQASPRFRFILDTADVDKRWRSTEAILQRVVSRSTQVANGRHRPSYFGMVNTLVDHTRDGAARL